MIRKRENEILIFFQHGRTLAVSPTEKAQKNNQCKSV